VFTAIHLSQINKQFIYAVAVYIAVYIGKIFLKWSHITKS